MKNTKNKVGYIIALALISIYVSVILLITRYHFLDDAFIHLRVAHNLLDRGYISFNGLSPHYVTSSPLYSLILSMLSFFSRSSFIPLRFNW